MPDPSKKKTWTFDLGTHKPMLYHWAILPYLRLIWTYSIDTCYAYGILGLMTDPELLFLKYGGTFHYI